jgi:hypothetical protein
MVDIRNEFSADEEQKMRAKRRDDNTPDYNPAKVVGDAATTSPGALINSIANRYAGDRLNPMARLQTYRDQKAKMKFDAAEAQDISDKVPRGD